MDKIIAFCGAVCSECPAFLATKNDDDNEKKRILFTKPEIGVVAIHELPLHVSCL